MNTIKLSHSQHLIEEFSSNIVEKYAGLRVIMYGLTVKKKFIESNEDWNYIILKYAKILRTIGVYILAGITLLMISGCRDYITGLNLNPLPILSTDSYSYNIDDTIGVTLENSSYNNIYVKSVYNIVEKEIQNNWETYKSISCSNCTENPLAHGQSMNFRGILVSDPGTYRLVCFYGQSPGLSDQSKSKVYSNTFTVQ